MLLSQDQGIGHNSLDNYLAQISGQAPDTDIRAVTPRSARWNDTQKARVGDEYVTHQNPFMYFHPVIDQQDTCAGHVVDLSALATDLQGITAAWTAVRAGWPPPTPG
ncbi:hypothetical protein ACH47Z_35000 [Streptomyces sp. NPDC020192]|uniref:hypothetical protein n=1 Tax=Streptomyces sp. NPDC020192 TaxID=3365066 RepID=UPI00379C1207